MSLRVKKNYLGGKIYVAVVGIALLTDDFTVKFLMMGTCTHYASSGIASLEPCVSKHPYTKER